MNTLLPLIMHSDLQSPVAYRGDRVIRVTDFLADVVQLTALLPAASHILNVCSDRYRFCVGLAAAMCAGKISLLPSTHTPEAVRQLCEFAPDVFCLTDFDAGINLPTLNYPADVASANAHKIIADQIIPAFSATQLVAYVFTSGSTGTPVAHPKTWGALVGSVRAEATRFGMLDGRRYTLVGTVPAQHMYGFESTVLLALQSGAAFWAGKPFFAADIAAALNAVPAPRLLVSTPFHLRAVIDTDVEFPPIEKVISATAPLTQALASEIEIFCAAPLLEIYGSTESGQIASRRSVHETQWQLLDGFALDQRGETTYARSANFGVDAAFSDGVALGDIIEKTDTNQFVLHGRRGDLINIAGKRTALGFLNHQLLSISGVRDGVFFLPLSDSGEDVTRLVAFVVAPDLSIAEITQALRERVDPLFLPRPLYLVEKLPRNAAGKLPNKELLGLLAQLREQRQEK
ncbi:MAG: forming CoA ligase [Verrucomicrobiaceae bacterium]|nr:forming CoA ligase [Verrucomicrobiaceae bacterium]